MARRDAYFMASHEPSSEEHAETQALFTSIGDGAITTDKFGRITRINPMALSILGFEEAEMLGEWFPKKIVAVNAENTPVNLIDRPITKAFLTGHSISDKTYYRRKSGDIVPVYVSVSPILINGRPLGAIEVFRDITIEEEIDRMKSEFISLASHQLRTPLSAIKTYSHMLADGYMGQVTPTQKKSLRTIIAATSRMNELISTLLNITRMESGTIAVTPKMLRVDKAVEEVIKETALLAKDKQINVVFKVEGKGDMSLRTDQLILKEIVTNLLTNAVKYTPEGGKVCVTVRARTASMHIEVADSGWGIPAQEQEQIFTKFFRAQNILKRETTGTGLGLYLVKGLVDALDGRIVFTSTEGKGTVFSVTLPRKKRTRKEPRNDV